MDHITESNTKRSKKSSKEKNTFDKYGKNTQKGARIKSTMIDKKHFINKKN